MLTLLRISLLLLLCSSKSFSQEKTAEFDSHTDFSKANEASGYSLKGNAGYRVNLQLAKQIVRNSYDNNYKLKDSYEYHTKDYTLNNGIGYIPIFTADLQLEKGTYELYSDKKKVIVVSPDFLLKRDSIIYSFELKGKEKDEKRLAVIPYVNGLRILSFSNSREKLYLYDWKEDGQKDTVEFSLPVSSLSPEETKKYTKYAKIKYKSAFDQLTVSSTNTISAIGYPGKNYVYYSDDKIWLVLEAPLNTGFNVLELDINKVTVSSANYFVNDMKKSVDARAETLRTPYALIWKNFLIIRNSSYYFFQYYIYDLTTRELIKEYTASYDDSLQNIIHSDLNQKGTWLSGGDEKKLDNEKAYLRKLASGEGFIFLARDRNDSITITTGSLKATEGLAGTLLSMGTMAIGFSFNFSIGNFQIIPFLQMYRNKLVYNHSCFSLSTFEPSGSQNITTTLDQLLDNFEKRDLKSKSSFILLKDGQYIIAVFNPDSKKFELYTLRNG